MQDGGTPWFIAPQQGHQEVVCLLFDAGADKDIAMQGGAAPLLVAFQQGRQEVVCLLSDAGADKDIAMQGGATSCSSHLRVDTSRLSVRGPTRTSQCRAAPLLCICDGQGVASP